MLEGIRVTKWSASGFHTKQYKGIFMDKGVPLESRSSPESARITLTSPICVQEAPAKLAVREPNGPIQYTIM
eukprot:2714186-Pyramimonas_sp.AAC.1